MSLHRLVFAIRRRLKPPKVVDCVGLPLRPFKPVDARIESGLRPNGEVYETIHFETWEEGFTPDQLPLVVTLCVKLAERFHRDASLPDCVRANLCLFLRAYGLGDELWEETEDGWQH